MGYFYDTYVKNQIVNENIFLTKEMDKTEIPVFDKVRGLLPQPFWQGHEDYIACYWKAWELAFRHIKKPTPENGFVSKYIPTCFNDCLFMWDSVFALMFGKYGRNVFNFQNTLDNLYAKQHPDGFICREIAEDDGSDRFHRFDPSSTGPNILPWSEWEYYKEVSDTERLRQVFPVLLAYHRWLRAYRTWPDGTYWSSGWGAGLDNQPRLKAGESQEYYHGHMVWMDACIQMILSAKIILKMAAILGRASELNDLEDEIKSLTITVNERLWDEKAAYYFDMYADSSLSGVKTISAYWALLADIVPADKLPAFISHLDNSDAYNRPHRVPSMPADSTGYCPEGNYWRGGVWVFTNYMLLKGLTKTCYDTLAYDISLNHLENVVKVFNKTGTIWENYAPESISPGNPAKPNFVGAGGVTPIAIMFEYVFGLRADAMNSKLTWDVRRLEAHGVKNYPFGKNGMLDIKCESRSSYEEEPKIIISNNIPITVELRWNSSTQHKIISI